MDTDRLVLGACLAVIGVMLLAAPLWVSAFHLGAYAGVSVTVDEPPAGEVPVTDRSALSLREEAILESLLADGEVVVYAPVAPDHPGLPPAYRGRIAEDQRGGYVVDGQVTYEVRFLLPGPPTGIWVMTAPVGAIAGLSVLAAGYLLVTDRFDRRPALYILVFGLILVGWVGNLGNLHGYFIPIR